MDKEKQIEEMAKVLNEFFDKTPMELSFKYDNGNSDIITDKKALKVLDDITRQALIPCFAKVLVEQGYRLNKQSIVISIDKELQEEYKYELKEARKQAVKEVLEKLHNSLDKSIPAINGVSVMLIKNMIDEIAKEFGVELCETHAK